MSRSPAKIFSKYNNRNFHLLERRDQRLSLDLIEPASPHHGGLTLSESYFAQSIENKTCNMIRRVIYRLIYLKVRRCIKKISNNLTLEVLRNLSSKLYHFAKDKSTTLNLRLRLLGESWPPVIIYQATVKNLKTITLEPILARKQFESANNTWRALFSDLPVILVKSVKARENKSRPFGRRNITPRPYASREMISNYRFSRIGESITYSWKSKDEREYLRRPDVKYASPSSLNGFNKGLSFHSIVPSPPKSKTPLGVSFMKKYREDWQALYFSEIKNSKNSNSIFC
jgi:hypothetical protein